MFPTPTTLRRTLYAGAAVSTVALGLGASVAFSKLAPATPGTTPAKMSVGSESIGCLTTRQCITPEDLRVAYGVEALTRKGVEGQGETVVLPEAAISATGPQVTELQPELAQFDKRFDLPAPRLQFVRSGAPGAQSGLAGPEEALDVQMVHAIAPDATIRIVLSRGGPLGGLPAAVSAAGTSGSVVSVSAGISERCVPAGFREATERALRTAMEHRVTVVASGGDNGAVANPCDGRYATEPTVGFPSSDPLVLSAGGTQLAIGPDGSDTSEMVWNGNRLGARGGDHLDAAGGGFSQLFARPTYQAPVTGTSSHRAVPDVAADAAPEGAMAHVVVVQGKTLITPAAGTSASAPFWAGIVALADQEAGRHLGFVNPAIYRIGESSEYHRAFHDVTAGDNTVKLPSGHTVVGYDAKPGWDPVTGWGSPDAAVLVPLLARQQ